ncbi:MAG: BamA/TamA family outer membrane protein [Armatimonadetes bacterium]|nr:BamA/TamA family outer membrane protein [Armatimonadota bacterium]
MAYRISKTGGLVLLTLLAGLILIIPTVLSAQETARVTEVAISGNKNINTDTIQNAITLKPGDEYTDQAADKDKASIMSLGYFSAVTVHKDQTAEGVKINYEVTENPKITDIKVVGSEPLKAEQVRAVMKTKPGQVLNTTSLNQDIEAIQELYKDKKYIAYVTEEIGVDPQTGVLTVPILVHRVESVEITGNKKTKTYVFLREMKTGPGKILNLDTLNEDIRRIYNLDILEDIKPYQINPGTEVGLVKITIPVVEKKTGQVSVGLGYSSRQRLVGQARLQESNFKGKAQNLNLLWEQGTTQATGGSASYELGFFEPWIDKQHTSLNVTAFDKLLYRFSSGVFGGGAFQNGQFYNERHKGGDVTVSRPLTDKTRVYVGGRFENVDADPNLLFNSGTTNPSDLVNIIQKGNVAGGSLRMVHNTRDIDIDPAAGGYEGISLEFGTVNGTRFNTVTTTQIVNGVSTPVSTAEPFPFKGGFQKASVDLRRYFSRQGAKKTPQDKRTTIAIRMRTGYATGKIPYFEQFFVGGSESLRGYREDRFWGDRMLLTSIELRKPIAQSISGVIFVDYGDAWGGDPTYNIAQLPQHQNFQGSFGTGVGIRVTTPIGHLRLDYGVGKEGARTHFSMGQAF